VVEGFLWHVGALSPHRHRSHIAGLSCVLIGAPALWGLAAEQQYVIGPMGIVVAIASTSSDYLFVEAKHFRTRRQCYAFDLIAIYTYVVTLSVVCIVKELYYFLPVVLAMILIAKFSVLEIGSWSFSCEAWAFRHTSWHVFVTCICMVVHGTIAQAASPWYNRSPASTLDWFILLCAVELGVQLVATMSWMAFHCKDLPSPIDGVKGCNMDAAVPVLSVPEGGSVLVKDVDPPSLDTPKTATMFV